VVFGVRDALLQLAGVDRGAVRPDQSGDAGANGQQGAFAEWVAVEAVEPCPQRGVVEVQPRFNWAEAQEVLVVQDFDPGADRCPPGRCRFSDSATDVPDLIVVCGGLGGESEPSHAGGFRGGVVVRLRTRKEITSVLMLAGITVVLWRIWLSRWGGDTR
jgi:hypothetical protein